MDTKSLMRTVERSEKRQVTSCQLSRKMAFLTLAHCGSLPPSPLGLFLGLVLSSLVLLSSFSSLPVTHPPIFLHLFFPLFPFLLLLRF